MGFYFRKSVKFGPFRLNFSKSGIGVSAGVKGARISAGPRGTYVHAGANGFYYKQRIGGGVGNGHRPRPNPLPYSNQGPSTGFYAPPPGEFIYSADVSRHVDANSREIIDQINEAASQIRIAPFAALATIAEVVILVMIAGAIGTLTRLDPNITAGASILLACSALVCGGYVTWSVHQGDNLKRTTPLFYELEPDAAKKFREIQNAVASLGRASRLWRVQTQQLTYDQKRNAGAMSLVTRTSVMAGHTAPPYVATNVEVWGLSLNDQVLYFMPDYVFVRQNGRYGALPYSSFRADFTVRDFIEEEGVPPDSQVVNTTWRFVNKGGGPDRRFSNNYQLPVVEYGFVHLTSTTGLNIYLYVSNPAVARHFASGFSSIASNARGYSEYRGSTASSGSRPGGTAEMGAEVVLAYETLGASPSFTPQQLTNAYRELAKMYHPDRLHHLAPEFIELAEERMKEINIAFDLLKKKGFV